MYKCFKSLVISDLKLIHAVIIFTVLSLWTNFIRLERGYPLVPTLFVEKNIVLHRAVLTRLSVIN